MLDLQTAENFQAQVFNISMIPKRTYTFVKKNKTSKFLDNNQKALQAWARLLKA